MTVLIQSKFDLSDAQRAHIDETTKGLTQYDDRITQTEIFLKLDDGNKPNIVSCTIRVHIPGNDIVVSDAHDDRMKAFMDTFHKAKRQLIEQKAAKRPY